MSFENKNHWYDGLFYDKLIAPNQDRLYLTIKNQLQPNSKIIDVGCGTGRLANILKGFYSEYIGIDPSIKNIDLAKRNFNEEDNISFIHSDIKSFSETTNDYFDFAIMTYVIHEVENSQRIEILESMSNISERIIIGDYLIPRENNFWNKINGLVEFIAGNEHYKNFKDFEKFGGLLGLIENSNFKIIKEIKNSPQTAQILVLEKEKRESIK